MTTFPRTIWISPTSRCNARCRTCIHHASDFGQDMPEQVFDRVHDELLARVSRINLVGCGEPLLSKRFHKLLDACVLHGVRPFFITNTILLTQAVIEKCVAVGAEVMVSFDGACAETFESIRQGVRFNHVVNTLERIRDTAAQHPESSFKLISNTVVMRRNIPELPDIVRLLLGFGVETISFADLVPFSVDAELAQEVPGAFQQELIQSFTRAEALARSRGVRIAAPPYYRAAAADDSSRFKPAPASLPETGVIFPQRCFLPWTHANILEDGSVTTCCASGMLLGSLAEKSFAEIWDGPRYKALRRLMGTNNPTAHCKYCNLHSGLNAGDPSYFRRFVEDGVTERMAMDDPRVRFTGGGFAFSEPAVVTITRRATMRLLLPETDFLGLILRADDGRHLARMVLPGRRPTYFDTTDTTALVDIRGLAGEVEAVLEVERIDGAVSGEPATLQLCGLLGIGSQGLRETAASARSRSTCAQYGAFIQRLVRAVEDWIQIHGAEGKCYGLTGIVDIGEELAHRLAGSGLRLCGYYDHHAGHIRQHALQPFSSMVPGKPDLLVLASPYQIKKTVRALEAVCRVAKADLLHVTDEHVQDSSNGRE